MALHRAIKRCLGESADVYVSLRLGATFPASAFHAHTNHPATPGTFRGKSWEERGPGTGGQASPRNVPRRVGRLGEQPVSILMHTLKSGRTPCVYHLSAAVVVEPIRITRRREQSSMNAFTDKKQEVFCCEWELIRETHAQVYSSRLLVLCPFCVPGPSQ